MIAGRHTLEPLADSVQQFSVATSPPPSSSNPEGLDRRAEPTGAAPIGLANGKGPFARHNENEPTPALSGQAGMHQSIDQMFEAGGKGSLPGTLDPQAAAAGAREKGYELGDDALSDLLMAWYYAGYSTGLAIGKQRASLQ